MTPGFSLVENLFTHIDFDGIGSAALFSHHFSWKFLRFTTPKQISFENVSDRDAVLDLPFSRRCAFWFDHHEQNFEEPALHGIQPLEIPGLREPASSCARVVLSYYQREGVSYPDRFEEIANEIDYFDSMLFESLDDWMAETPGKVVNDSLVLPDEHHKARVHFFIRLTSLLAQKSLEEVADDPEVQRRYQTNRTLTLKNIDILNKISRFHPDDRHRKLAILDFSSLKFQPFVDKKYILLSCPDVEYIMSIYPYYQGQTKTNTVSVSISRNFLKKDGEGYDWGKFFADREIGGGHRDAAGARLEAASKAQRDKLLEDLTLEALRKISEHPV